jgi:hypothetical protein
LKLAIRHGAIANTSNFITPTLILVILNQLCLGYLFGNCTEYSNIANVHAIPPDVPPILDQNYFNICLNDQVTLVARSGYTSTVNVGDGVIIILVNSRQMGSHTMEN